MPVNIFALANSSKLHNGSSENMDKHFGPERVIPGKLSVSRTIGDLFAKDPNFGGNPRVVIPEPEN